MPYCQIVFPPKNWKMTILIIWSLIHLKTALAKNCEQIDACSCKMDDGSGTIDLSKIGTKGDPLIKDVISGVPGDFYQYSFNPCYPFDEGKCTSVAGCQIDSNNQMYYDIGDEDKVTFSYDDSGGNLIGTYVAGDGARTSIVQYQCDPSVDPPATAAHGEQPTSTYNFAIISKYACPQSGPGPGPGPSDEPASGLSAGWILVIVFICLVSVYLIGGVLFNVFYRKESGRNMVPNVTLWGAMPGLIKEGFRFSIAKVRRSEYQPIK